MCVYVRVASTCVWVVHSLSSPRPHHYLVSYSCSFLVPLYHYACTFLFPPFLFLFPRSSFIFPRFSVLIGTNEARLWAYRIAYDCSESEACGQGGGRGWGRRWQLRRGGGAIRCGSGGIDADQARGPAETRAGAWAGCGGGSEGVGARRGGRLNAKDFPFFPLSRCYYKCTQVSPSTAQWETMGTHDFEVMFRSRRGRRGAGGRGRAGRMGGAAEVAAALNTKVGDLRQLSKW